MNSKIKFLIYGLRLLFFLGSIYFLYHNHQLSNIVKENNPIKYELIDYKIHRGGKRNYSMTIHYNNNRYQLSITSNIYNEMLKEKMPRLFYDKLNNKVFSSWQIKVSKRLFFLFLSLSVVFFIPFAKISRLMDKAIEKRNRKIAP